MKAAIGRNCVAAGVLVVFCGHAVSASEAPELGVGQRVRVMCSTDGPSAASSSSVGASEGQVGRTVRIEGTVAEASGPDLVIDVGGVAAERQILSWSGVSKVQVFKGRKRATKTGFWTGAAIAGVAGGLLVGASVAILCNTEDTSCSRTGAEILGGGAAGAAAAGLVGGAVGAGIGALFEKDDWQTIHKRRVKTTFAVAPQRDGMSASLSVRF
jgi:hypothetical protein